MQKKYRVLWGIVVAILLFTGGFFYFSLTTVAPTTIQSNALREDIDYQTTPTLFLPGWANYGGSFNGMIADFQKEDIAEKAMTIHVSPFGHIRTVGDIADKKNPLIQVVFDWNFTRTYQAQTRWVTEIILLLHNQYKIDQLNVVAHSWGGTAWIHAFFQSAEIQKKIEFPNVILLGVPVEESLASIDDDKKIDIQDAKDPNFKELLEESQKVQVAEKIHFYNLLGEYQEENSDGEVPHIQSQLLQELIHPEWSEYTEKVFSNVKHDQETHNQQIADEIVDILWRP